MSKIYIEINKNKYLNFSSNNFAIITHKIKNIKYSIETKFIS